MNINEIINEEIDQLGNIYTLYHTSKENDLTINNDKNIWLTPDKNYAKIWGDNLFEIKISLNNILDAYSDLGNKTLTIEQLVKYLKSKNVNVEDFEYVTHKYRVYNNKFLFWEWVNKYSKVYGWLPFDIFHSGYDAIRLFEYGYSKREKGESYLVNKPKDKIKSINKLEHQQY